MSEKIKIGNGEITLPVQFIRGGALMIIDADGTPLISGLHGDTFQKAVALGEFTADALNNAAGLKAENERLRNALAEIKKIYNESRGYHDLGETIETFIENNEIFESLEKE